MSNLQNSSIAQKKNVVVVLAYISIFIGVAIVVVSAMLLLLFNLNNFNDLIYVSKTGALGDTFNGILGPFLTLILAILTYAAFKVQYDFNKEQLSFNFSQEFRAGFFDLYQMHLEVVKSIQIETSQGKTLVGKACFKQLNNEHHGKVSSKLQAISNGDMVWEPMDKVIIDEYFDLYSEYQSDLGSYYRTLYHIFKYVLVECKHDRVKLERYFVFIRAQLTDDELQMLYYNFKHPKGIGFLDVVGDFDILAHLDKDSLLEAAFSPWPVEQDLVADQ
jgi:hypothetical protein